MKRSTINRAYGDALACFRLHHWALPPSPRWDITDFGLGDFERFGLTLVTLTNEPEYCEKVMFARRGQRTPSHAHMRKKEDIICRAGELALQVWPSKPAPGKELAATTRVALDGVPTYIPTGSVFALPPGSRVTLEPGVWHSFWPTSPDSIIGEVSTTNDDQNDNVFADPEVGRFPAIEEDEPPRVRLVGD